MEKIRPGLYRMEDSCNVYLLIDGDHAIAVDFGSGAWLSQLPSLGVRRLDAVFLTHHHADQCSGLAALHNPELRTEGSTEAGATEAAAADFAPPSSLGPRPAAAAGSQTVNDLDEGVSAAAREAVIHAPKGESEFLSPDRARELTAAGAHLGSGCPKSYDVLPTGLEGVAYDMVPARDLFWRGRRLRFISTPGHGPNAVSIVIDVDGDQLVFCGDAVHSRATIWKPYHLEWDHWTGEGALAAWHGVRRLRWAYADLLCPSHGPVLRGDIASTLDVLSERLLRLVEAKGGTAPWEPDRPIELTPTASGGRRVSEHLYQFGGNGYLLVSDTGEALVVDPNHGDRTALDALLGELSSARLTAAVATHYHLDHTNDLDHVRRVYGAVVTLHPAVAEPLRDPPSLIAPWLPSTPVIPDRETPWSGTTRWNEYEINWEHAPGQTWWHAMCTIRIDGNRVLFAGDTFQPPTRWHGTGGFCAYNRSRFSDGVAVTCARVIAAAPDIVAAGHGTVCAYSRARFEKTRAWAHEAEAAVTDLCPGGDFEGQYFVFPRAVPG